MIRSHDKLVVVASCSAGCIISAVGGNIVTEYEARRWHRTMLIMGDNLKYYRAKKRLSSEELAQRLGMPVKQISGIENATCEPEGVDDIKRIAMALNITVSQLMEGTDYL